MMIELLSLCTMSPCVQRAYSKAELHRDAPIYFRLIACQVYQNNAMIQVIIIIIQIYCQVNIIPTIIGRVMGRLGRLCMD